MSRYFFDVIDDNVRVADAHGFEFSSIEAARSEASRSSGDRAGPTGYSALAYQEQDNHQHQTASADTAAVKWPASNTGVKPPSRMSTRIIRRMVPVVIVCARYREVR